MRDRNDRSHRPKGTPDGGRYMDERNGNGTDDIMPPRMPDDAADDARIGRLAEEQERALADACRERRPFDDYERTTRREYIRLIIRRYAGYDTRRAYSTTDGNGRVLYDPGRQREHDRIVSDILSRASGVERGSRALMSGGLGGAGKSSILVSEDFAERFGGFDPDEWLTLNNDDIKEMMAQRGLIPHVRGLTPMESCFLVHEEAGDILADLRARALDSHMNVILDGTMNGPESTERKIRELRSHGYSIRAMFVDISPATSKRRADGRYRDGMVRYTTARLGHGGRYLPSDVVDGQEADAPGFSSRNALTLIRLADRGLFDGDPIVYDNNVDGMKARPVPYGLFRQKED